MQRNGFKGYILRIFIKKSLHVLLVDFYRRLVSQITFTLSFPLSPSLSLSLTTPPPTLPPLSLHLSLYHSLTLNRSLALSLSFHLSLSVPYAPPPSVTYSLYPSSCNINSRKKHFDMTELYLTTGGTVELFSSIILQTIGTKMFTLKPQL